MMEMLRIVRVAWSARRIQDFLWQRPGVPSKDARTSHDWNQWIRNLQLRIEKVQYVDTAHRNWRVEAKKRLLQLATVAIGMMEAIDKGAIEPE